MSPVFISTSNLFIDGTAVEASLEILKEEIKVMNYEPSEGSDWYLSIIKPYPLTITHQYNK